MDMARLHYEMLFEINSRHILQVFPGTHYPISKYFACTNHMHVTVLSVVGDRSLSERILITATATVLYRQTQEILTDFVEEGQEGGKEIESKKMI